MSTESCKLADDSEDQRSKNDTSYEGHLDLVTRLKDPVQKALSLSDEDIANVSFYNMNGYCDTIFSRLFEGLPLNYTFSDSELHDVYEINKWSQVLKFSDDARSAWMTMIFSYPINMMDTYLDEFASKILDL